MITAHDHFRKEAKDEKREDHNDMQKYANGTKKYIGVTELQEKLFKKCVESFVGKGGMDG